MIVEENMFGDAKAWFSDDFVYRYRLYRLLFDKGPTVCFLMLNPSTADAWKLDPTLSRCRGTAIRNQFAKFVVVNLYALRSYDPKALWKADDPVGPDNDWMIRETVEKSQLVVCGWGTNAKPDRVEKVMSILRETDVEVKCWGRNAGGSPKHPLYLPRDTKLVPFDG